MEDWLEIARQEAGLFLNLKVDYGMPNNRQT